MTSITLGEDKSAALANAKLLFKALAAREASLDEPISNIRVTDVAVQIGLEGDEVDSALDFAGPAPLAHPVGSTEEVRSALLAYSERSRSQASGNKEKAPLRLIQGDLRLPLPAPAQQSRRPCWKPAALP